MARNLSSQNHAAYQPADTDATVVAGYRAQMAAYAAALRSNGTAFYNSVFTGGPNSGILVMLHPLSRGTVNIDPARPAGEPLVDYRALSKPAGCGYHGRPDPLQTAASSTRRPTGALRRRKCSPATPWLARTT